VQKPAGARNNPVAQSAYKHSLFDDEDAEQAKTQQKVRDRLFDNAIKQDDMFSDNYSSGGGSRGGGRDNFNSRGDRERERDRDRGDRERDRSDISSVSSSRGGGSRGSTASRFDDDDDWGFGGGRDLKKSDGDSRRDNNSSKDNGKSMNSLSSQSSYGGSGGGGGDDGVKQRSNAGLTRFANATSISSANYYDRDESTYNKQKRRGNNVDEDSILGQIVEVTSDLALLGEGMVEVGSKLADYASDFLEELQEKW
jgi:hypothetical protein